MIIIQHTRSDRPTAVTPGQVTLYFLVDCSNAIANTIDDTRQHQVSVQQRGS